MSDTLYDRLGGAEGLARIASDLVDNHLANPLIAARFSGVDVKRFKRMAALTGRSHRCVRLGARDDPEHRLYGAAKLAKPSRQNVVRQTHLDLQGIFG